ncbi:hypothetical protein NDX10_004672 [Escherichia coli]|nr:hypothetical protein [Escherichia coli]
MSAFSFNTTYQPTGDQQKDAIAQIGIMQNNAVKASLAYQSNQDSGALFKVLHQVNNELHDLTALMASISTPMSRPCGMMRKWWYWSWADWKTVRPCWLR